MTPGADRRVNRQARRVDRRLGLTQSGWTVAILVALLLYVELGSRLGWIDSFLVPPLSSDAANAVKLLVSATFWQAHLFPTLFAVFLSFVIAVIVGLMVGFLIWRVRLVRMILDPWLAIYYAIPIFALYPLLVVIMGVGLMPIVFIASSMAVVAVITATVDALDSIPKTVLKLAHSLDMSVGQCILKIYVPGALNQITVGLRLALSFSIIGTLASEFILSTRGMGYFISYESEHFDMASMYGAIVLMLLLAVGINAIFGFWMRVRTQRIFGDHQD